MKFAGLNKYFIVLFSLTLLLLYGLNSIMNVKVRDIDIDTVLKNVESKLDYSNINEGTPKDIKKVYGINPGDVLDSKIFISKTNMKADQVLILKVKKSEDMEPLGDKIQAVLSKLSNTFKDYEPAQYALLENKVLINKGKYIFLFVGENSFEVSNAFKNSFK